DTTSGCEVTHGDDRLTAERFRLGGQAGKAFAIDVDQPEVRALSRKGKGGRTPDALGRAGDENDLVLQSGIHPVSVFFELSWLQTGFWNCAIVVSTAGRAICSSGCLR